MIEFKLNEKEYKVPASFNELTFGEYCRIFDGLADTSGLEGYEKFRKVKENQATVVSRLMGEADDFALNLPLTLFAELSDATSFIFGIDIVKPHNSIVIDGVTYMVPKPDKFSLRQWIDADMTIQETSENKYIELLAILLLPLKEDGEFGKYTGEYQKMADKLRGMPCSECLGIVSFFLRKGLLLSRLTSISLKAKALANLFLQNIQSLSKTSTGSI